MTPHEIVTALEKKGITRYKISKDTGISNRTLGRWSRNKASKHTSQVLKMLLKNYFNENIEK